MALLTKLVCAEVFLFLGALFLLVVSSMLSGRINMRGLLHGKKGDGTTYFSPERVQLLLVTLGTAFQYLLNVQKDPSHFPPIDASWLAIFGGSHFVYLGGKLSASLLGRSINLR